MTTKRTHLFICEWDQWSSQVLLFHPPPTNWFRFVQETPSTPSCVHPSQVCIMCSNKDSSTSSHTQNWITAATGPPGRDFITWHKNGFPSPSHMYIHCSNTHIFQSFCFHLLRKECAREHVADILYLRFKRYGGRVWLSEVGVNCTGDR